MLVLQGFQIPVEAVVLGVGDLRRVVDVVAAVVVADLLAQFLYLASYVHASGHAGIIRTEASAPKRRLIPNAPGRGVAPAYRRPNTRRAVAMAVPSLREPFWGGLAPLGVAGTGRFPSGDSRSAKSLSISSPTISSRSRRASRTPSTMVLFSRRRSSISLRAPARMPFASSRTPPSRSRAPIEEPAISLGSVPKE